MFTLSKNKKLPSVITALFIVLGFNLLFAQPTKSDTIFFDDFSGNSLNRKIWNVIVTGWIVNNEQQAYVDSSATIYISKTEPGAKNGALVLQAKYQPGFTTKEKKKFDFISGRIDSRSKMEFTYGTVSARMILPAGTGYWPAFWALGAGDWPETGEIDIMENVGETDWTSVALHGPGYSGETPLVNKYFFEPGIDITLWHVYSVDWNDSELLFHVDGKLVYRATRQMVENYGKWSYDNPKFLIINLALGGAYPYKTNLVKTPYNGIPESTLNSIKEGKGRVLVDWVSVVKKK